MRTRPNALLLGILLILLAHANTSVAGDEDKPFDYFYNSWNWVGLRNYRELARVTPDNAILLEGKNQLRFKYGQNPDANLKRISRRHTKTALEGWLPVMLFSAEDGPLRYELQVLGDSACRRSRIGGRRSMGPPKARTSWSGRWSPPPIPAQNPSRRSCRSSSSTGTASKLRVHSWSLAPATSAEVVIRVPFKAVDDPAAFDKEDPKVWLRPNRRLLEEPAWPAARRSRSPAGKRPRPCWPRTSAN